jgi:ABC-type siderophore export system fused ATPase/permease subunit
MSDITTNTESPLTRAQEVAKKIRDAHGTQVRERATLNLMILISGSWGLTTGLMGTLLLLGETSVKATLVVMILIMVSFVLSICLTMKSFRRMKAAGTALVEAADEAEKLGA